MSNPFLFTEEVGTTQLPASSNSFNPFLAGGDFGSSADDNPFAGTFSSAQNVFDQGSTATNPFALGESAPSGNLFSEQDSNAFNYENIFSQPANQPAPAQEMDLFGTESPPGKKNSLAQEDLLASEQQTNIFSNDYDGGYDKAPPKRPPPPRPGAPPVPPGPPKETKDLILSVTGAMDATSSHLLDRLQATRTPSPTPMRDLHSPSPTQFGDLLEVDEPTGIMGPVSQQQQQQQPQQQELNLLGDDFDLMAPATTQPTTQPMEMPKRPSIPDAGKRPSIPDLGKRPSIPEASIAPIRPAPVEVQQVEPVAPVATKPAMPPPPSRPAPPVVPDRPRAPPQPHRPPPPARPTPPEVTPSATPQQVLSPPQPAPPVQQNQVANDIFGASISYEAAKPAAEPEEASLPFGQAEVPKETPSQPITTGQSIGLFSEPPSTAPIEAADIPATGPSLGSNLFPTTPPAPPPSANVINENKDDFFEMLNANRQTQNNIFDSGLQSFVETTQVSDNAFGEFPAAASTNQSNNIFDAFNSSSQLPQGARQDDFDAFAAKFESVGVGEKVKADPFDPFSAGFQGAAAAPDDSMGFGTEDNFDNFLSLREPPPVPQGTPARVSRGESAESNDDNEFNIFIKPKTGGEVLGAPETLPSLAPPPKSPSGANAFQDGSPRFNPFDNSQEVPFAATENIFAQAVASEQKVARTDSQETPPTPLFDEDVSQPLEDFPRTKYDNPCWEMQLRQPNKKKITGQSLAGGRRFWKKIYIKLVSQGESPVLQLFNGKDDKDPFQELPLQPCYSVSEIGAQQYDQYGKIFTVKLQFIFYKERPGVRPGQVTKAERLTNKLSQFAAYAIQGDYQGCKEFGSDLKKLGLPVEHAPQISQLFKIGSQTYEDMKQFSMCVEESLFRLSAHRDRALNYKMEEVQITAVDELYVEQNYCGVVEKQIARVRLFFLGFLSGMPDVEVGVNDLVRQGKEVVGRHDIIPVVTEEWIRLECVEFHSCVQQDEYEQTRTIRFKPPDACYIELMRFRVRPPRNRELPLQLKVQFIVTGNKVEIRADILVPGFSSRKLGQIPCEDVMVRIPIPECWIYQFRVEKHFRYGSVKSAHRRTGKVKGIERFLGAVENLEAQLMEATSGQAKYEHQHHSIVWRMPRLPKEGQGAYTTHNLVVRMQLTSFDQIPDNLDEITKYAWVEFTMPACTVSHMTVRSVSIQNSDSDAPPEKYVRHLSRHEYRVEIEHTQGEGPADYIAATISKPTPVPAAITEEPKAPPPVSDSDSDSG